MLNLVFNSYMYIRINYNSDWIKDLTIKKLNCRWFSNFDFSGGHIGFEMQLMVLTYPVLDKDTLTSRFLT
jgi:hypothetical protein